MRDPRTMTDSQIEWNIRDINEAISAMPENPKIYTYLREREALHKERTRRQDVRVFRRALKMNSPIDPLSIPFRPNRMAVNAWKMGKYAKDAVWSANWNLAHLR